MEWLGKELGYTRMKDWYKITIADFSYNNGSGLLQLKYNSKPQLLMISIFPKYNWLPWKFVSGVPTNYWNNIKNRKIYMEWLGKELGYTCMEDWYEITRIDFINNYGSGMFNSYYNYSLRKLFKSIFPEYQWESSKFRKNYSKGQIEWLEFLRITIPDIQHMINNEEGEFKIPNSHYHADGYSKENNLILEYHGDFWHGNPKIYNPNDVNRVSKKTFGELYDKTVKKRKFCEDAGFNYIEIWESEWFQAKNGVRIIQKTFSKKN